MFDLDNWKEILASIIKNPVRTFLTALGVSWGIFMLVIMFGAGKGLENGVNDQFGNYATNSMFLWGGVTTKSHNGMAKRRTISFENKDIDLLKESIPEIEVLAARNQLGNFRASNNVTRREKSGAFSVYGDFPEYAIIDNKAIYKGRFINKKDIDDERKVCVIGERVREVLFEEDENPIGSYIKISGVFFKVIGVYGKTTGGNNMMNNIESIYIPFSTFQKAFNYNNIVSWFAIKSHDHKPVSLVEEKMIKLLKKKYDIAPDDQSALGHFNLEEEFTKMNSLFAGISILTWIVGGMTLIAGVIGISNIMLVVVKERTKEIGIKRAIGARPVQVVMQVILEAIVLTFLAGFMGLIVGTIIVDTAGRFMDFMLFKNPEVDIQVALTSILILSISGVLAGIIPAYKAVKVKPVEALRTD